MALLLSVLPLSATAPTTIPTLTRTGDTAYLYSAQGYEVHFAARNLGDWQPDYRGGGQLRIKRVIRNGDEVITCGQCTDLVSIGNGWVRNWAGGGHGFESDAVIEAPAMAVGETIPALGVRLTSTTQLYVGDTVHATLRLEHDLRGAIHTTSTVTFLRRTYLHRKYDALFGGHPVSWSVWRMTGPGVLLAGVVYPGHPNHTERAPAVTAIALRHGDREIVSHVTSGEGYVSLRADKVKIYHERHDLVHWYDAGESVATTQQLILR